MGVNFYDFGFGELVPVGFQVAAFHTTHTQKIYGVRLKNFEI